jgi:aryl-alcohol dehydrogenase-like predicted oxidoreductase
MDQDTRMEHPANPSDTPEDFLHRTIPRWGKSVYRVGLAPSFGLSPDGIQEALEGPINYLFWSQGYKATAGVLRELLPKHRERLVIATGPTFAYFKGQVRKAIERSLRTLNTDYLDVVQIFWAGKMSALTAGVEAELVKLREEGKAKTIGLSIHDRPRAGRLAEQSIYDLLMIRYNAAHPGAETDTFPHLATRKPILVSYTATSWRKLLKAPRGWQGPPATAGDCYRFVLSNPHVDVVLCGPKNTQELRDNLRAIEQGPLSPAEMSRMRAYGKAVHG